jgi:Cytochrome c554 and c-prime
MMMSYSKGSLLILAFFICSWAAAGEYRLDSEKVQGPNACAECHKETVKAWNASHHSSTFKQMPRSDDARMIANKLGIKRIKSESSCLGCHFTMAQEDDKVKPKPIAGISCESCHGAGAEWIDEHSDFGGKDIKADTENPEHKIKRYALSEAAGMIRPSNLYALAENCYSCHTVPDEKLVNVGGHTAGSKFELVRWSQGEVRHNLWYTDDNRSASLNRRRMLYIIGKMLDLEYALRGVAKATEKKTYAVAMAKRVKRATAFLKKIDTTVDNDELTNILAVAQSVRIKLNNEAALLAAAEKVSMQASMFSEKYDGSEFSGVDALLPSRDKYKGSVFMP